MKKNQIKFIELKCKKIRHKVLELCHKKGGHVSTSFSCVEIIASIYYSGFFNISKKKIKDKKRDIFVLSKGHGAETLYAILSDLNFFPKEWIKNNFRDNECKLGGHADAKVPGVELSTGSLGHGLGYVAGIALSDKIDKKNRKYIVLLGDAECTAGSVWEAASFISLKKLSSVLAIVDLNKIGATDFSKNFMNTNQLIYQWKSFGWNVIKIKDGNNLNQILKSFKKAEKSKKPSVLIANTVKGKGAKVLENSPVWHSRPVTEDIYKIAKKELD